MLRTMMKSKIHRATVTQADLHYVGSVTVDEDLLEAADLLPGELVHIVDITNGARLETYTIAGERGLRHDRHQRRCRAVGAPWRPGHPHRLRPDVDRGGEGVPAHVVFVDADNKFLGTGADPAETFGDPTLSRGDHAAVSADPCRMQDLACDVLVTSRAHPPPSRAADGAGTGLDGSRRCRDHRIRHRRAHRCAAAARSTVGKVLVVTKDVLTPGSTQWAQGGIAAALGPEDTPEEHEVDTLVAGAGACDRDAVRVLVTEGPKPCAS